MLGHRRKISCNGTTPTPSAPFRFDFPGYLAQQPPKSLQIVESNSSSLIMNENIYTRILVQTGLRFRAEALAVISSPLDGLPADIPCFRTFDGGRILATRDWLDPTEPLLLFG